MSSVRELHDEAMRLAQLAQVARHNGDEQQADELARQAYQCEAQAAELVPTDEYTEPTRSILYRSAASLALQAREFDEAKRLISEGLSGNSPQQIEQEFAVLKEQVHIELLQAHEAER